jgi:hypothetical protein
MFMNKEMIHITITSAQKYFAFILIIVFCCSCYQDVVDINLSELDQKVVIEGSITDQPGPYTIKISKTASIYEPELFPRVSGANVVIYDDNDNFETLTEIEAGKYQTSSLQGVPGRTYTLQVIAEGKEYTATSKMPVPIEFSSVVYVPSQNQTYYNLLYAFQDHVGIEDYCRIKLYRDGEYLDLDYKLYHDSHSDGELIEIESLSNFFNNDLAEIELFTIEKGIYEFFSTLAEFDDEGNSEGDDIIGLAPSNPNSNISNNALGYFSAQTYRKYQLLVR